MTPAAFLSLAAQTVTAPREVARLLISMRLGQDALLTAFALVVVLNALIFAISQEIMPSPVSGLIQSPFVFLALQAVALGGAIASLAAVGRALGGQADLSQIAVLMIWLQALRILAQAALLVVVPISVLLGSLLSLVASGLGVWIALNFVDEAHEYESLFKSAAVLILGLIAMAVGLSILLSLSGFTPQGIEAYV